MPNLILLFLIDYIGSVIGKLSDYFNVDSEDNDLRKHSEISFDQEVKWCIYLGIQTVIFSLPANGPFTNLARIVYGKIKINHSSPTVKFFSKIV